MVPYPCMPLEEGSWENRFNNPRFGVSIFFGCIVLILLLVLVVISATRAKATQQRSPASFSPTISR